MSEGPGTGGDWRGRRYWDRASGKCLRALAKADGSLLNRNDVPQGSCPAPVAPHSVSAFLFSPVLPCPQTSTLHRAVSGSEHRFLTLPPGGNKLHLLAEVSRGVHTYVW